MQEIQDAPTGRPVRSYPNFQASKLPSFPSLHGGVAPARPRGEEARRLPLLARRGCAVWYNNAIEGPEWWNGRHSGLKIRSRKA